MSDHSFKPVDRIAPPGAIWVCSACGKSHRDRYGMKGEGDRGWDESCCLNAVLCDEATIVRQDGPGGRIVKADIYKPKQ